MNARTPIRGLAVAISGASLALPCAALAGNGGVPAPAPGGTVPVNPGFALTARHGLFLGGTLRISGTARSAAGKALQVQERRGSAGTWLPIALVTADSSGSFSTSWRPASAGEFSIRGLLPGAKASDAGSSSAPRTVLVYRAELATWYGPGFYGRRTACGQRLTRSLVGVAHRRLRCGTPVEIVYRGHTIVAPVVDRGPFAPKARWDLTAAAARQIGMTVTSRIGAAPLDLSLRPPAV